jgi:uncharacterized membrane protein
MRHPLPQEEAVHRVVVLHRSGGFSITRKYWLPAGMRPRPRDVDGWATRYGARMRHVATLIAAIVIAPLVWILVAFGQDRSAQAFANAHGRGAFHTGDFLRPLLFLAAAGILLGLIATLRFSPLGAVLAGAAYAASYAVLLIAPQGLLGLFGHTLSIAGRDADLSTPIRTGTTLLLGAVLLVAVASVGRWRRWPRSSAPASVTAAPDQTGSTQEAPDRALGADGLGLSPVGQRAEPEFATRSPTGSAPAATGGDGSHWAALTRDGSEDAWR